MILLFLEYDVYSPFRRRRRKKRRRRRRRMKRKKRRRRRTYGRTRRSGERREIPI